ncbi:MAG: energy transducer TonB [Marinifilaceae bacterium]
MIPKKNPKVDLEKLKTLFFEIGLFLAIVIILISFEWRVKVKEAVEIESVEEMKYEEELIPITRQETEPIKVKPPPKISMMEVISIVDDEMEVETDLELGDVEATQDEEVDIVMLKDIEEEEETLDEAEIFVIVEEMPLFRPDICKTRKESDVELYRYIYSHIKYPAVAQENGISGRVFVKFVVDKDGSVTNVQVIRGVDPSLDKEAVRVIQSLPKFSPGKQRGTPVRVAYSTVIKFVLQ